MNSNSLLFAFGAITFLVTFSWFKYAAMEVFKKELKNNEINVGVWSKLFKVFLVDWLIWSVGQAASWSALELLISALGMLGSGLKAFLGGPFKRSSFTKRSGSGPGCEAP